MREPAIMTIDATPREFAKGLAVDLADVVIRGWRWLALYAVLTAGAFTAVDWSPAGSLVGLSVAIILWAAGTYSLLQMIAQTAGYRPATAEERDALRGRVLVHYSRAAVPALLDDDGRVNLDVAFGRPISGMVYRAGWRLGFQRAVFFFSETSRDRLLRNTGRRTLPTVVVIHFEDVAGDVYIKPTDGSVALPNGYRGPGVVRAIAHTSPN